MYPTLNDIHFVGIGGIGMSGLAEILLTFGCRVTGSDLKKSPTTDRLKRRGAKIFIGHKAENVSRSQVVVVSSAVSKTNPEVLAAQAAKIPVIARAQMLAELMRLKYGVAVAGSHGKTTTTSLVSVVLAEGGLDPTMVIGGKVKSLRSNAHVGKGDYLVAEADESDGSFMHLNPTIAVITNIDREHMDHYRDFGALRKTFESFASKIPFFGLAVFCADHPETANLAASFPQRKVTYGLREKADYEAKKIRSIGWGSEFDVWFKGKKLGKIGLNLPGEHNVLNSLAAIAVGCELGVAFTSIRKALMDFRGVGRRLELIYPRALLGKSQKPAMPVFRRRGMGRLGEAQSPIIIDDYGHHPVEVQATLSAARSALKNRRLWVLFQPHRYTRTKDLFDQFVDAFSEADELMIADIYAASEEPIQGVTSEELVRAIMKKYPKKKVSHCAKVADMADSVAPRLKKGDVVLTLGAGDIWKAGKALAEKNLWN